MQDEFMRLQSVLHKTIVFITHDFDEAIRLADRIAIMKDGAVEQIGTPEEIVLAPATDYVAEFTARGGAGQGGARRRAHAGRGAVPERAAPAGPRHRGRGGAASRGGSGRGRGDDATGASIGQLDRATPWSTAARGRRDGERDAGLPSLGLLAGRCGWAWLVLSLLIGSGAGRCCLGLRLPEAWRYPPRAGSAGSSSG